MRLLAKCVAGCFILGALTLVVGNTTTLGGEKGRKTVKVGDPAPAFQSVDENGKTFKSSNVVGKKIVVLYFYPADFTGGCTAEACGFRDDIEKLNSANIAVIGVSGDSVETHKLFKADHKLPFTLLADEKGNVAKAFGIPHTVAKVKTKGKDSKGETVEVFRGATISRYTVVIDKAGKVAAVDQISKSAGGDAKRVAELVKNLDTK